MKKINFSILLLFFAIANLMAANVEVTVTMNPVSKTMTLVNDKTSQPVEVGTPTAQYAYTFSAEPGGYTLTAYDANKNLNGTIKLNVTEEGKAFQISTVTTYLTNENWVFDTDYTIQQTASSREGTVREITLGQVSDTGDKRSFLMLNGDTYVIRFIPSKEKADEGYLQTLASATVTANSVTATKACVIGQEFTFTAPKDASVFLGTKRGSTHYVPFEEVAPKSKKVEGDKEIYTYMVTYNSTYNYRVKQEGKLTRAGKIGMQKDKCEAVEITAEQMNAKSPKYINHDPADNGKTNVADIFLNLNRRGLLRLSQGNNFQIVNLRTWQIADDQSNNYYMEPDFRYTVLDENFQPSQNVVTVDEKGLLKAVGKGRAIVQITYDAVGCFQYNKIDGFGNRNENTPFMGGEYWSAIWPENTGTFVVTVDEEEDASMKPHLEVQTELPERLEEGNEVDSEHDIFYYMANEPGYYYTFKTEGISKVEVANPDVKTNPNIATYSGFTNKNVTQTDDKFTVLLTFGRNIIRMTSPSGKTTYQVVSAKPVSYEITNVSRSDDKNFYPGDSVQVQFNGFYHPANKLAGVYNMSAYLYYNGVPNGTSLILGPGQYTFAGDPRAQAFSVVLPNDWEKENLELKTGALQVKGYGSKPGDHRGINLEVGRNPNFTASVHINFWGAIPNVTIPVTELKDGIKFAGLPEGDAIDLLVKNQRGDTILANEQGVYYGGPREYTYEIFANNRKASLGSFSITAGQGIKTIQVTMDEIATTDNSWDGEKISLPEKVSAEESVSKGGKYEGLEGYYKIKNGYELAWLSYFVNKTKDNSKANAILIRDIDLKKFDWTPIGKSSSTPYTGIFEGGENTINGLYIKSTDNNQALFGYATNVKISNLTLRGSVTSTGNNVGGFIGDMENYSVIENCHNQADISGASNVGGLVGKSYHYPAVGEPVATIGNCSNTGKITGESSVGGIGGYLQIYIYRIKQNQVFTKLSNSGNVSSTEDRAGGIAGRMEGLDFENVYNTGDVKSDTQKEFGGIAGYGGTNTVITNAYNTGVVAQGGSILGNEGTLVNTYTINGQYKDNDNSTVKSKKQFESGEVAWLLGNVFGQEIGEDSDAILEGKKVYQVIYTNNLDRVSATIYTNGVLPVINREGYNAVWQTGKNGDLINEVSEDSKLYVFFTQTFIDGISINTEKAEMVVGEMFQLVATVRPETASNKTLNWISGNEAVATVDENGLVTAISAGRAVITVLTEDGGYSAGCEIMVSVPTGIEGVDDPDLSIYYDSNRENVIINTSKSGMARVYRISGSGQLNVNMNAGENRIDVSGLSKGFYVVQFGEKTLKFAKK